jgi:DNA invertase Pin-like site-specific DNA recombinase
MYLQDVFGRMVFVRIAIERDLILKRTLAGVEAARASKHHGGRPRALDGG